jgi:hypothetical protein
MLKGTIIQLNPFDILIAKNLSAERQKENKNKAKEMKIDDCRTGSDISEQGVMAEIAFAKLFNVYFDTTTEPRAGGYDTIYNGWKTDVKTTTGKLLICAGHKKMESSEIYVLMLDQGHQFEYAGWCYNHELIKPENKGKEKYTRIGIKPDTYVIEPYEIHGYDIPRKEENE